MNFDFKPIVSIDDKAKRIIVTSPKAESTLLWEITNEFTGYGVFTRNRPNRIETRLEFSVNPDFQLQDLIPLVIGAVYVAHNWRGDTKSFWSADLNSHLDRIKGNIKITFDKGGDFSEASLRSYKSKIAEAISVWIFHRARLVISNKHTDVAFAGSIDEGYSAGLVNEANRTLGRLKLTDPKATVIGKTELRKLIGEIEGYLVTLGQDHMALCKLSGEVKDVRETTYAAMNAMTFKLDSAEIASVELYQEWLNLLALCDKNIAEISRLVNSFDYDSIDAMMSRIREFAPACDSKK